MRKLPGSVYAQMREMREQGATYQAIADELGLSRGTVHRCLVKRDTGENGDSDSVWHSWFVLGFQSEWARRSWAR